MQHLDKSVIENHEIPILDHSATNIQVLYCLRPADCSQPAPTTSTHFSTSSVMPGHVDAVTSHDKVIIHLTHTGMKMNRIEPNAGNYINRLQNTI